MVRYKPSQFTKKELEAMVAVLATDAGIDLLTGGKLNKYKRKAALAVYRSIVKPVTTRVAVPAVASVARTAAGIGRLAFTNPYVVGGTLIYVGYKERDRIAQLLADGAEIVREEVGPPVQEFLDYTKPGREQLFESMQPRPSPLPLPGFIEQFRPRKQSKYNKAVSAAMKAVKASTKGGKKGTISNPKSVFKTVSKAVSKVNRGAKASTKGISGIAARAARRILGKPKKKPKKTKGFTLKVKGRDY
jgi:hypothetical protein